MLLRLIALTLSLATVTMPSAAASAQSRILFAQGHWAAIGFGARCVAHAKPLPPSARRQPAARAGFTFSLRDGRHGEFHARLSRVPRGGSSVMLTVGEQPFLLVARGDWAWSRGPRQEAAIIAAVRSARSLRIEARDASGRRFADRYLLAGAPSAIDAAAAGCAGKSG